MAGAFWTLTVAILCSLSHVLLCAHSPQFGHQLQDQFLGSVTTPRFLLDDAGPHPLLRALLSERVPTSTVRAMMTNYLTGLDLGHSQTLAAVRMANHRRHQLAQTLMFLRMLQDEMTETIKDIQAKDRVYTFQVEGWGCNCSLYYRDERGQMRGFFVDVVLEVCKEAGKICKVQEHPFADCMSSNKDGDQIGGKGLLGRQFDACFLSPGKSVEHIVSMIDSVVEYSGNARFYVKKENVDKFDPTDVTGKKIVFYNGWHSTPDVLRSTM
ncbi:uncharacterized protein [Ptychodera flava]|uniref:uncharacterized protein n=1 Tax=Ptychodera flava TaxID=63121 RepID=UPI00396A9702